MKKTLGLLILLLSVNFLFASDKNNIAVLFNNNMLNDKHVKVLKDSITSRLNRSKRMTFDFFTYDEKSKIVNKLDNEKLRFSKKLFLIDPIVEYDEKPPINFIQDKETKKYTASFIVDFEIIINSKLIDVASSLVELIDLNYYSHQENTVADYKKFEFDASKYINGTLPKRNTKAYQQIIDAIWKDYSSKLKEAHSQILKKEIYIATQMCSELYSIADENLFNISPIEGKKKMGSFEIDAGIENDLFWLSDLRIVKVVQYGEYTCGEYLGTAVVKKRENAKSKCGFLLGGGGKLKKAIESNEKVYAARNRKLINNLNSVEAQQIRLGLDADCLFCDIEKQKSVYSVQNLELIERSHKFILDYFIPKYKTDQFIDYDVENVLGLQEGVEYLLRTNSGVMTLTEIATSRVQTLGKTASSNQLRQFLLDFFSNEITILDVEKNKKDQVKEIIIYSPYGFEKFDVINTYSITQETVGGKVYDRKEKIGFARVVKKYSDNIVKISISKNKKVITETLNSGGMIGFGYYSDVINKK